MVLPQNGPEEKGVVVAIDVDNLLISSAEDGQKFKGYNLIFGFHRIIDWIKTFGKILCVHLYLPASQSVNDSLWEDILDYYRNEFLLETIYCPKRGPIKDGKRADDVDRHLIDHTRKMVDLFGDKVRYFCLASGDSDYSPLLWSLKRERDLEIAFVIGSEDSFSKIYRQMGIAAKHPVTDEELIHLFSPQKQ